MFENTFNNCSDYKSINLNSKFFKEEIEEENNNIKNEISKDICEYYNYEINQYNTMNLVFGGSFNNFSKFLIQNFSVYYFYKLAKIFQKALQKFIIIKTYGQILLKMVEKY